MTSGTMTLISTIRDLHRRKGRERRGLALAEGVRLVEEMVAAGIPCKGVLASPALQATPRGSRLRSRLLELGVAVEDVDDHDLAGAAATEHPQGVIAVYPIRQWALDDLPLAAGHPLVILDAVQDPGNVGTIARTALSFGAAGLIALPGTADLANPKTVRGAMGALFRLPHLHAEPDAILDHLAELQVRIWATVTDGIPVAEVRRDASPIALIFGNEAAGVAPALLARADLRVGIPIDPGTESLNVAVAAAIVLYQVTR
ncbi:MAG: TrmH family RNA methyltransferase [Gemmatimonadales bacterium]